MPSLILMRHAKAVDRFEAEDDFDRALNDRGHRQACEAGEILKSANPPLDLALVSPALRTQQTWVDVKKGWGIEVDSQGGMSLYHASPDMLRRALTSALESHDHIMLIGHNPGIGALVHSLAADIGRLSDLPQGWPTSALMRFELKDNSLDSVQSSDIYHNPKLQK